MAKKHVIRFKQSFPNVELKYRYVKEIDEIVLEDDVVDLKDKYNSERHTCLKDTLQRFLGEDYAKLYGEQEIIFDDNNFADEFEKFDKVEFYTQVYSFCSDLRKKYNLPLSMSLDDIIKHCNDGAKDIEKNLAERGFTNEKV